MRNTIHLLLLACVAGVLTGCSPVMSLKPLAGEEPTVEASVAGLWANAQNKAFYTVIPKEDKTYRVVYNEGSDTHRFDLALMRIKGNLIADVSPADPPFGAVAGHFYYRLVVSDSQIQLAAMSSDWLRNELQASAIDKETIVTELPSVRHYLEDARSFDEAEVLHRVGK